jgi:hypothetical protein
VEASTTLGLARNIKKAVLLHWYGSHLIKELLETNALRREQQEQLDNNHCKDQTKDGHHLQT